MNETIEIILTSRGKSAIMGANGLLDKGSWYIGGGAIAGTTMNDIDVYPALFKDQKIPDAGQKILASTKNSVTIKNDPPVQFCKYFKESLQDLVKSFDFTHIQAGVKIVDGHVTEVYYTEEYLVAKAIATSIFTGSEYPLSSGIRLLKYFRKIDLNNRAAIEAFISILVTIYKRGFTDYTDFKDQLDAIDLGLLPEDFTALDNNDLINLFELLRKDK